MGAALSSIGPSVPPFAVRFLCLRVLQRYTHSTRMSVYGPCFGSFILDGKCDAEFTPALGCQFSVQLLAASCGV
jgi:hypothetical protein